MRSALWTLLLAPWLAGCAALPPAAWGAIGAVAGASSQFFQLDDQLLIAYENAKGRKVTLTPQPTAAK